MASYVPQNNCDSFFDLTHNATWNGFGGMGGHNVTAELDSVTGVNDTTINRIVVTVGSGSRYPADDPTSNNTNATFWFAKFDEAECFDMSEYSFVVFDHWSEIDYKMTWTQRDDSCENILSNDSRYLVASEWGKINWEQGGRLRLPLTEFQDGGMNFQRVKDWTIDFHEIPNRNGKRVAYSDMRFCKDGDYDYSYADGTYARISNGTLVMLNPANGNPISTVTPTPSPTATTTPTETDNAALGLSKMAAMYVAPLAVAAMSLLF